MASSETGELAPLAQFFELHGKLEQNSSTSPNLRVSGKVIIHGEGSSIFGIIIDFAATFLRRIFVLI